MNNKKEYIKAKLISLSDQRQVTVNEICETYSFLSEKHKDYAHFVIGIIKNNTWQGKIINSFLERAESSQQVCISYGSSLWTQLQRGLLVKYLESCIEKERLTLSKIRKFYCEEYRKVGLQPESWLPEAMFARLESKEKTWNLWLSGPNPNPQWNQIEKKAKCLVTPIKISEKNNSEFNWTMFNVFSDYSTNEIYLAVSI